MHRVLGGFDSGDDGLETDDGDKEEEEEELVRAIGTVVVLATDKDETDESLLLRIEFSFVLDGDGGNKGGESLNRVMAAVEVSRAQVC
jgi:hypothetical protein